MFKGESIRLDLAAEGIAELCFDARDGSVNKLDRRTIDELQTATAISRGVHALRGVLVTSAKEAFIVGADIFEFPVLFAQAPERIEAYVAQANAVFAAFEDLDVPIVTALNGLALGGGLELALASDARVMSEAAQVGLPEVSLGLFPGFGGTVRLPRVAGAAAAIDWIGSGKPQSAQRALAAGVVDKLVAPAAVRQAAIEVLESLVRSGEWRARRQRRHGPFMADATVFLEVKRALAAAAVHQPAALAVVELLERAAGSTRDQALQLENAAFAQIAKTQAAASLIQLFINDQAIRKKAKEYAKAAPKARRAAILGAGIMGGGIAYTAAARGIPVTMKDIRQEALDAGIAEARRLLSKQVDSGRMNPEQAARVLADIHPTLDHQDLGSVDIVVEAVVENLAVKKSVLAEVEQRVGAGTVLASNTSSLSISEMAGALRRPASFVGMHFFNPVPQMPLVEVIRGSQTGEQAVAAAVGFASALGKTPIVVKECPGFLVNRILMPYMLGFLRAVRDGADYLEIDRVMEAFGWPMGPAYLQDVVGMDTLLHVLETISAGFEERMRNDSPHAVALLVRNNRLGQKNGVGYYRYESDPKGRPRKTVDPATATLLAGIQSGGGRSFTDQELLERLMLPLVIEAARCLEEGIAASAAEVDTSLVLGLGFPRHAGGPLKYADWLGLKQIVAQCEKYAALGPLYTPTEGMRGAASKGTTYY
jgi:3-hydroxyacyl-CoA dehydrogenase / enoyl-CoA hydratase / 3-hydroxybutyryl-CoA epimerase / enoyl-CoA isomerase